MEGDDIGIALNHDALVLISDRFLTLVEPVEDFTLIVNLRLWAIDVLGDLLIGTEGPTCQRYDLAR